jgi:hypothetical protein
MKFFIMKHSLNLFHVSYIKINKNANLQDLKYAVSDIVKSWVQTA